MSIYEELQLERVINANATLTRLGGSRMPREVVKAMSDAADAFVDLDEMQARVGDRIAELTHNEAAYVSCGAAAGITVAVAAMMAGTDPIRIDSFPHMDKFDRNEVIVYRSQRNGYDYAARQTGANLVEIGAREGELIDAISDQTACILWFAGAHYQDGALPIEELVDIAKAYGVPVIVDAAAQIPPVSNLWYYTRDAGADIAIFSGGKGLRGPQSSGLVLGKRDIIEACRANGNPNSSVTRPMKVGKEEMAGVLAALEWTLAQNEESTLASYEACVQKWISGLSAIPGITVERQYPSVAGAPHGRAAITIGPDANISRDEAVSALWNRSPRIAVAKGEDNEIFLNPHTLEPGEDDLVLEALREILGGQS
jgi:uncharacterized pyridoxal phosphate-dependent enzyme